MADNDENRFKPRPAAPRSRAGPRPQRFVSRVLKQISKSGAKASGRTAGRPSNTFGRGRVAASLAGQRLGMNARRVVVKSRFVTLRRASPTSVALHLRYIERDGVTRDGQKGQAYGADTDVADLGAFQERGRQDRHQFRFIVSAEDGSELEDLRGFTRQLMQQMEKDLETRLDWVAVDHWDTDNPHTHIVLNGRTTDGSDLVIAPNYLAHGMRLRASEIATEWLGPRTELEVQQSLLRDVDQQRLTPSDRMLIRMDRTDGIDLREKPGHPDRLIALRARLQQLEAMGLATKTGEQRWKLDPHMAATLTAMGEQMDALETIHRALKGQQRECVVDEQVTDPVIGRIAGKGLADELQDLGYLVVDGVDGRAHYVKLPASADLAELPVHGVVEVKLPSERAVDRNISAVARDGLYRTADHLVQLQRENDPNPQSAIDAHVRRLEALRRSGLAERLADGVWKLPQDFLEKTQQYDAQKTGGLVVDLHSHLPIAQQVRAVGATWLDKQLVANSPNIAIQGFGAEVRDAMRRRMDFLNDLGLARQRGSIAVPVRNMLGLLRDKELTTVGKAIQEHSGLTYQPALEGMQITGMYRRRLQLVSGAFALLDDGVSFSLVPWRPVIERDLGQQVSAVVHGPSVSWQLGRQRSIGV